MIKTSNNGLDVQFSLIIKTFRKVLDAIAENLIGNAKNVLNNFPSQ
jgi:hypothetical protein